MEESETHSVLLRLCVKEIEIERRVCDTIPMLLRLCAWKSWVCIRILDRERGSVGIPIHLRMWENILKVCASVREGVCEIGRLCLNSRGNALRRKREREDRCTFNF